MDREKLLQYLSDCPWGKHLILLDDVRSTNLTARELALHGAPHGTVVLVEHQSAGKGRLGRSFSSPAGLGIYCSVILRIPKPPEALFYLTPVAAEAVRQGIREVTGLAAQIKWVNDLLLQGRKLCGILTQISTSAAGETEVILGIGINCHQKTEDFPVELRHSAISLYQALGHKVEREAVTAAVLKRLHTAMEEDPKLWLDRYRGHCITIGKDVYLLQGDTCRQAYVEDMDEQGALLVRLADGSRERVCSGEVSVRGLDSYG